MSNICGISESKKQTGQQLGNQTAAKKVPTATCALWFFLFLEKKDKIQPCKFNFVAKMDLNYFLEILF